MGEGEPPPVLPGGAVPPALLPARGPAAARARSSRPAAIPGRSFGNAGGGAGLYCLRAWPAPAHVGHRRPVGAAAAAPALALQTQAAPEPPGRAHGGDFGGSQGRGWLVPGPASRFCGAREMCGLGFGGVGVRCLSGRSLLCSFGDFPSPGFLFRVAALGVKVRVGLGSGRGCEGLRWQKGDNVPVLGTGRQGAQTSNFISSAWLGHPRLYLGTTEGAGERDPLSAGLRRESQRDLCLFLFNRLGRSL